MLAYVTYIVPGGSWGLPVDMCVMSLGDIHQGRQATPSEGKDNG